jgi:hypothetical protein
MKKSIFQSPAKTILLAGLVAGTLDIFSAIIFLAKGNWQGTLKFISRHAFGDAAANGGNEMLVYGILFHYIIAFSFAIAFFIAARYISFLRKNAILWGVLYGIFVWAFMNLVVLPFTKLPPGPISFASAWKNILILMLAVGLPVSLITRKYYSTVYGGRSRR